MEVVFQGKILCVALVACGLSAARGQDSRANVASRTAATLERTQAAAEISNMALAQAEADLGAQLPVRPKTNRLAPYVIGNAGLYYTSNPSLSRNGGRGDVYFVGGGGAGIRPNLIGGLWLDGHVSQQVYQYAQFSSLNFNYFNAGGGLDYVFQGLGQLTASVRFEYQRFLDGQDLDEFYVNNALTVALYKEFKLNEPMAIQMGWVGSFSLSAEPSSARRNEFDFWLGWRWRILSPLELQTYYMLSLFYYPQSSRLDATSNVGAALNLSLTRWARLTASTSFGANNSTQSVFDYTVVNVGGTLSLEFRF
jgi:hypothetical protein